MAQDREHFRINLDALVKVQLISDKAAHELATLITSNAPNKSQPVSKLTELNKQIQDRILMVSSVDLQVGHLFDLINQKLNLIQGDLEVQKVESNPDQSVATKMPINLSGGGALIYSQKKIEEGTHMDLSITFIPEHVAIRAVARAVKTLPVKDNPNGDWKIAVEFIHMHEDDQDRVVRKVLQEQTKQLRERQESNQLISEKLASEQLTPAEQPKPEQTKPQQTVSSRKPFFASKHTKDPDN